MYYVILQWCRKLSDGQHRSGFTLWHNVYQGRIARRCVGSPPPLLPPNICKHMLFVTYFNRQLVMVVLT